VPGRWRAPPDTRHRAEPRGIAQVRHEARKTLEDWQVGAVADAAELAVSEMLTDALHFGRIEILAFELSLDEPGCACRSRSRTRLRPTRAGPMSRRRAAVGCS
jgi:hypothetical protein